MEQLATVGGTPGTVLIADDNPEARRLLDVRVKREGYATILVENGRQALETVQAQPVDAILLDIYMPEKDGFEVLAAIKAQAHLAHVPILMISGGGDQDDLVRCIEMGALDYLPKPFNQAILKARLSSCIAAKRQRDRELGLGGGARPAGGSMETAVAAVAKPTTPTRLGQITLGRLLGSGRLGQVFLGHHELLGLSLAVKILHPEGQQDPEQRARILREARVAARLNHRNIVRLYEVGESGPDIYLAYEHVEGGTLESWLRRQPENRLSVAAAVRVLREVAAGLQELQRNGLTHRDIKPANLLLSRDGEIKIADLALAKPAGAAAAASATLTAEHHVIGTPAYMAPEQIQGSPDLDIRCDLYALGAVLYEMLTGKLLFDRPSNMATMLSHLVTPAPAVAELRSDAPDWLQRVCAQLLAKDRMQRYATPEALLADIQE